MDTEYALFSDSAGNEDTGSGEPAAVEADSMPGENPHLQKALAEIAALDPDMKSLEDLKTMPHADRFHELVLKGNSLTDAFRLARFEDLSGRRARQAQAEAIKTAYGKAHLTAVPQRAALRNPVPAETLELYRALNPGLRDEDYRSHYTRAHHDTKRG